MLPEIKNITMYKIEGMTLQDIDDVLVSFELNSGYLSKSIGEIFDSEEIAKQIQIRPCDYNNMLKVARQFIKQKKIDWVKYRVLNRTWIFNESGKD